MKIEIGAQKPEHFTTYWPGQYEFKQLNIHAPKNLITGEGKPSAITVCKVVRLNEEA